MLTVWLLVCALIALARADVDTSVVEQSAASCPDNWSAFGGRCFHFVAAKMTWAEAEKNCISMNAHLASIHSAEENQHIAKMIIDTGVIDPRTWIGGSDCQQNGFWLWADASHFSFSSWGSEQPDNDSDHEACVEINFREEGKWNDAQCSLARPSLCARSL